MFEQIWIEFKGNLIEYLSPERLSGYLLIVIRVFLILLITRLVMRFIKFFVEQIFRESPIKGINYNPRRVQTLKSLTVSVSYYVIYFVAGTMILETFEFPVTSLLAGAGIFGLAIGFGAQGLVKDVIIGFFILFEHQFSVGDHVRIGDLEGIVQEVGLRSTRIKSFAGQVHIIPNGEINVVTNFVTTESMRVMFDVGVAYEEDIDKVIAILEDICKAFAAENEKVVEGPKVLGVQDLGDYAVSIRILARVIPMEQWDVERRLKHRIKKEFDAHDIEIPYPKRVLFIGPQTAEDENLFINQTDER